jgi:uncharacterized protein (DUF488 family)
LRLVGRVTPGLYTVGHSNHTIDVFVGLLAPHGIELVVDVRSQPHSRFNPQYNRERLSATLAGVGIEYAFLGAELGARARDPACYVGERADYTLISHTSAFTRGIDRTMNEALQRKVALLCAEKDPLDCHRAILVCPALAARGIAGRHILADGSVEEPSDFERRLLASAKLAVTDLFDDPAERLAEAYRQRGLAIAYRRKG